MKSRRSSDRRRDLGPQPEFLIDRSLSQVSLPAVLRETGLIVHTLADIYGEKQAQAVEDTEWIALAAERDLVVFCKDDHIRRRPAERQALLDGSVRVFCLTNARLNFDEQAGYFLSNRFRTLQACRKPGPYVYGIYQLVARLREIRLVEFTFSADTVTSEKDGPCNRMELGQRLADLQAWVLGEATHVPAHLGPAGLEAVDTLIMAGIADDRADAIRVVLPRFREQPEYEQLRERVREIDRLRAEL